MNILNFIKKHNELKQENSKLKQENKELEQKILKAKKELSITKKLATGTKYNNELMYFRKMAEQIEKIEEILEND